MRHGHQRGQCSLVNPITPLDAASAGCHCICNPACPSPCFSHIPLPARRPDQGRTNQESHDAIITTTEGACHSRHGRTCVDNRGRPCLVAWQTTVTVWN